MEEYARKLVNRGNELYIGASTPVTGGEGEGDNGSASSVATGRVSVSAALWKVIVVLPVCSDDVNRISA